MELYIEKNFLDKFNNELNSNFKSRGKIVLETILKTYGDVDLYVDCQFNTAEQLELFNISLFALRSQSFPIIPISSIKNHFFEHSKCEQTLIFTMNKENWFEEAEKKGALCFYYENFEDKIESIISVCAKLKADLSEQFAGWDFFKKLKTIPKNKIIINDGYLFFKNGDYDPINENLVPLSKNTLEYKPIVVVEIYTNYRNFKKIIDGFDINIKKEALHNVFKSNYNLSFKFIQYHYHDRILYSNFFFIECGVGFNFNKNKKSNSKLTVDTIFDKFNYKRVNNHLRNLKKAKEISEVVL